MNADTEDLQFQCIDLLTRDCIVFSEEDVEESDDVSESTLSGNEKESALRDVTEQRDAQLSMKKYQILLYGCTQTGQSVCLQVDDFRPYFYIRIPESLALAHINSLKAWIREAAPKAVQQHVQMTVETHKTLLDYNAEFLATFLRVEVPSQALWRILIKCFLTKQATPRIHRTEELFGVGGAKQLKTLSLVGHESVGFMSANGQRMGLKLYEANIDPSLRFFHERDIAPAGWIEVKAGYWDNVEASDAKAVIKAQTNWRSVNPILGKNVLAPLTVASWDIECTSSHGDFPLAAKTWRKSIREMVEAKVAFPQSLEELCKLVAAAIRGEQTKTLYLSPVYLKRITAAFGPTTLPETIQFCLEGKGHLARIRLALGQLNRLITILSKRDLTPQQRTPLNKEREDAIQLLDKLLTESLPTIEGDPIIQIGTVLYRNCVPISKHIWVLGSVAKEDVKPPGIDVPIEVYAFRTEKEMLTSWLKWVGKRDVDVLIGYNVFGFDEKYVYDRLLELYGNEKAIRQIVSPWSRLKSRIPKLEEKRLSSSAMGDNFMYILGSVGRLQVDLLPYIRRSYNLDSYSLDNVSATFVSGAVLGALVPVSVNAAEECFRFPTKSTKGTVVGRYITLLDTENDRVVDRCEVVSVEPKYLTVRIVGGAETIAEHGLAPERWAQVKDDVSPKDIFRLHKGNEHDRAVIARYCLQDCDLVMELFYKLDILNNSVAMANVCSVPVSFIFLRGQGIKIESLIFKECRKVDQLIEVMPSQAREGEEELQDFGDGDEDSEEGEEGEDTYEGAIVLEPKTGIYIDDPVTADDFASLYPSSIISENISHDTMIWVKDYDNDGNFVCVREGSDRYDNISGAKYVNIEFDILRPDPEEAHKKHPRKIRDGRRVARYIQNPQGTIPRILEMLLASRKRCRKLAETEPDEFARNLLDAQQLAYKLTANSLYGQLGSGTFKVRRQVLAASTTAYGRKQLMYAKAVIEEVYGGNKDPRCNVECVYGDTDSIFLRFRPKDPSTGVPLKGRAALEAAKALTVESGQLVSSCLKAPHDFEFDKIFRTFCLLSKKRYVGDMSEDGLEDDDFHRKSMGIVMKRRDNAPIVKYVYGHAIDMILDPKRMDAATGVKEATEFVRATAHDLLAGKFPMSKLTITKSLRADYKDPTKIAHKVLADRIAERDPGNKPSTSDRIPFVYFEHPSPKGKLTGEKIELPSYIKAHGLKPDYTYYITNQISKPVAQVFGLALEHMPNVSAAEIAKANKAKKPVKAREELAIKALFSQALLEANRNPTIMKARGQHSIANFAKKT